MNAQSKINARSSAGATCEVLENAQYLAQLELTGDSAAALRRFANDCEYDIRQVLHLLKLSQSVVSEIDGRDASDTEEQEQAHSALTGATLQLRSILSMIEVLGSLAAGK